MWIPLETAYENYGGDFLIGKTAKVHDESHGWGDVEPNDEGTIQFFGQDTDGTVVYVDFEVFNDWTGYLWCFDVFINPDALPDEVDIL
jgi:hypothetical protein